MRTLLVLALLASAAPAQEAAKTETVAIPQSTIKFDLVAVPGSKAQLGDFWMGRREITWGEFDFYFEGKDLEGVDTIARPTKAKSYLGQAGLPADFMEAKRPLVNVRWHSAAGYCEWLSKKTGCYYRLPTEREWEFAARAGEAGDAPAALDAQAAHQGNSQNRTREAGRKPNAFGLEDMLGNVWEYCLESWTPAEFGPTFRGGAWNMPAAELKFGTRKLLPQEWFDDDPNRPRSTWWLQSNFSQGFRVARVAGAADQADREAAAAKVELKVVSAADKRIKFGTAVEFFTRVSLEVKNAGTRTLDEVEVMVFALDPKGKPHLVDIKGADKPGRATWTKGWPVMGASAHEGEVRKALKPGETRAFAVELPQTFDGEEDVAAGQFGGRVTNVRISSQ